MSTTTTNTGTSSEDIDLLLLIERALSFFKKYKWIFIAATILGLGLGYMKWTRSAKVYKSRLILHSYTLSNQDYIQIVDNWSNLLRKREYSVLAESFGVSPQVLKDVKEIKASEIQKVFTANNPNGFYIDATVTDNAVLDDLQKGILNGMENVDFIKKQLSLKKENLNTLIGEVEREIGKLDSSKAKIEQMIGGKESHSTSLIIDIAGLNKQLIELNEKLLNYKQDLKLTSAVQVLQGFSKFNSPDGPSLIVWLGLGLILFLGISFVYALYRSISRKLKARMASKH